ncbi:MAG: hypothetical protein ACK5T5_07985 [Phenylobacterium sp.]
MSRDPMRPGALRRLTEGEIALAKGVFGRALSAGRVRILALPVWPRAFVTGASLIVWPARSALRDFSLADLSLQAILVHELTHVWQAQTGVNLLLAKLRAGDGPAAYDYIAAGGTPFVDLNIEQQAMMVQDAFLAARNGVAPLALERYADLLSGTPFSEDLEPFSV